MGAIAEQAAGQADALRARGFEVMRVVRPSGLFRRLLIPSARQGQRWGII